MQERPADAPVVVVSGAFDVVRGVFFGGVALAAARAAGLAVAGNDVDVDAFFDAFAPAPIAGTGGPDPVAVDAVAARAATPAAPPAKTTRAGA